MLKKKFVETKGITLVALIITIVVLLLLSVVAIQIATGNFNTTEKAVKEYETSQSDEEIETIKFAASVNEEGRINKSQLIDELHKLGVEDGDISDSGTEIKVNYKGKTYTIPYNKKLISVKVALYDYINEENVDTVGLKLLETIPLNESTVKMPEGYVLYSKHDSSIENPTVVIENEKADKSEYTLNVCKETDDGEVLIKNSTGLKNIQKKLDDKYALDNDIDLGSANWTPLGSADDKIYFSGSFNGRGYTISNLASDFSSNRNIGFVEVNSGTIKNLNITSATVKAASVVGIIGGKNLYGATIVKCHLSVS